MKKIFSKILVFIISINLIVFPTVIFAAGTNWEIRKIQYAYQQEIAESAARVTADRQRVINGVTMTERSSAFFSPSAAQLAKSLAKGLAGAALATAVVQLLGAGVDWVLDPANNRVKYYQKKTLKDYYFLPAFPQQEFTTLSGAINYAQTKFGAPVSSETGFKLAAQSSVDAIYDALYKVDNTSQQKFYIRHAIIYDSKSEERSLPLEDVANKIKSNAAAGDATAQQAIVESAQDVLATDPNAIQQLQSDLDSNATTDVSNEAEKDPNDPNAPPNQGVKLPAFCSWAPIVCEAANSAIQFPKTAKSWWDKATKEISETWTYVKSKFEEEPEFGDKDELEVEKKQLDDPSKYDKDYVRFGGQCPTVDGLTVSIAGTTVHQAFDLSPLCTFATDWARPAILGLAYLTAVGIISNAIRDT